MYKSSEKSVCTASLLCL